MLLSGGEVFGNMLPIGKGIDYRLFRRLRIPIVCVGAWATNEAHSPAKVVAP